MTNQEIIKHLISVGQDIANGATLPDLSSLKRCDHINRMGTETWKSEAAHLTNAELISLLIGITYVERELKWEGGSGASAIWLFYLLLARDITIEQIDETAAWIIENTRNTYIPFGTIVTLGARNYSEYKKLSQERNVLIQHERERDREIERQAEKQRQKREEKRLYSAQRRSEPERENLIQKLSKMSIRDQLIYISKDDIYAPNFYPTKCAASADISLIESLPEETKHTLVLKLKGKHRGPWGAFKKRLLTVYWPVGNREPWNI
ncbi:MAG: hypothetical protein KKD50_03025 [Proteobacteria bacterium]|nr:hypothetical protein [Pseudomonadota bacterium]